MNTTQQHANALIRAEMWDKQLKEIVVGETMAKNYVEWVDFTHGDEFVRPIIGDMNVYNYREDEAVKYIPLDSGKFTFEITEYKQTGSYITAKARQDLAYAAQLEASIVPKGQRAMMNDLEAFILKQGQPSSVPKPHSQIVDDPNKIAGFDHRWVGSDVYNDGTNDFRMIGLNDFAKANLAFDNIGIPRTNRIAFVDNATAFYIETLVANANVSDNPQFEGIVTTGMSDGKRFVRNIHGWDIYTTLFLPRAGVDAQGTVETINGVTTREDAVANLFFCADSEYSPWIGAWRQQPKVEGEWNKDRQREEYVITGRYGAAPQNRHGLITILSDTLAGASL